MSDYDWFRASQLYLKSHKFTPMLHSPYMTLHRRSMYLLFFSDEASQLYVYRGRYTHCLLSRMLGISPSLYQPLSFPSPEPVDAPRSLL